MVKSEVINYPVCAIILVNVQHYCTPGDTSWTSCAWRCMHVGLWQLFGCQSPTTTTA